MSHLTFISTSPLPPCLSLFICFVLFLSDSALSCTKHTACKALPAHHPISHMPSQNGLTRHVNEWFGWVAACCLQQCVCECACLYVCISGGSCDDAHSDGGNAGGGDGVTGGGGGSSAVNSLSSLFPLLLDLPRQCSLTPPSLGSHTAADYSKVQQNRAVWYVYVYLCARA